jgi:hypothetical protein
MPPKQAGLFWPQLGALLGRETVDFCLIEQRSFADDRPVRNGRAISQVSTTIIGIFGVLIELDPISGGDPVAD